LTTDDSVSVPLAELPMGTLRAATLGGREIVLCRTKDGVFALDNICTHAYARLSEGRLRGVRLICPLHGAAFDVRDGRALGAPANRPLITHAVRVVADQIEVTANAAGEPKGAAESDGAAESNGAGGAAHDRPR
jgi:3-phenylpropionate/trans-cinnamate dioxygenase ferredoxin subunit